MSDSVLVLGSSDLPVLEPANTASNKSRAKPESDFGVIVWGPSVRKDLLDVTVLLVSTE